MQIEEIDVDEVARRLDAGVELVDVREPAEYESGHVPGAVLVPLSEVPDRLADLPDGAPYMVICRSGARSMNACRFLAAQGHDVVNVAGGTLAWVGSGRNVVAGTERG